MSVESFLYLLDSSDVISGDFDFTFVPVGTLMDMDFENKKFVDCKIIGGDFASGIFFNCSFDNVLLNKVSLVGVNFNNCHFIDCKLSNVECDFNIKNSKIDSFIITKEVA